MPVGFVSCCDRAMDERIPCPWVEAVGRAGRAVDVGLVGHLERRDARVGPELAYATADEVHEAVDVAARRRRPVGEDKLDLQALCGVAVDLVRQAARERRPVRAGRVRVVEVDHEWAISTQLTERGQTLPGILGLGPAARTDRADGSARMDPEDHRATSGCAPSSPDAADVMMARLIFVSNGRSLGATSSGLGARPGTQDEQSTERHRDGNQPEKSGPGPGCGRRT